jgi:7-cyano-7-deazaguanine reductase
MSNNPLGQASGYPEKYAPEVLYHVERRAARAALGITTELPFQGVDIWNAWELSWLDLRGKPVVATAVITVPADSPYVVESKSLKLYLNSFALMRQPSKDEVAAAIGRDVSQIAGAAVTVVITPAAKSVTGRIVDLPGECLDYLDIGIEGSGVDAGLLQLAGDETVVEELHSHLFRSLCPVTNQPDLGSVLVRYRGPRISRESLLRYLVSFRQHHDFHEACVERMFVDLKERCRPDELTVYARFNRRGGLDINPFRSDSETSAGNCRLWRQ